MEKKKRRGEKPRGRKKGTRKKTRTQTTEDTLAVIEDENHCQICGAEFQEDEEETCLGCDGCWRWVHCYCAGLDVPPDEDTPWFCDPCSADWTQQVTHSYLPYPHSDISHSHSYSFLSYSHLILNHVTPIYIPSIQHVHFILSSQRH